MISYSLKCDAGHSFDSWFQNASAYEALAMAGHVTCPACGSSKVQKSLMAPRVVAARKKAAAPEQTPEAPVPAPPAPVAEAAAAQLSDETRAAIKALKEKVEAESDYVGENFTKEARAMHEGETPNRSIYGQASAEEAIELIEDGIPVTPLPFMPTRKTN